MWPRTIGGLSSERANVQPRLILPARVAAEIVSAARRETPREACGILVGCAGPGVTEVTDHAPGRNVHHRPTDRFELAPEDLLAAERAARAKGLEVVGFWHSHPSSGAEPSAVDRAASWNGYSYLIVSLAEESGARLRSWRLLEENLVEEDVLEPPIAEGMRP